MQERKLFISALGLLVIHFLFSFTIHGTRPNISLYAHDIGASEFTIGLLVSTFAFLPMLFAIQVGKLLDTYGARRMLFVGGAGISSGLLIPQFIPTLPSLFVSQMFMGISHLFVVVSLQKSIGNLPGNRDKRIASLSLIGSLGGMTGPLASGFSYEHLGFKATFFGALLAVLTAFVISVLLYRESWNGGNPREGKSGKEPSWHLLKDTSLRHALIISGLVLYSKDIFSAYFPVYGTKLGMTPSEIGLLLSVMSAMALVVRISQFHLVEWLGRRKVLVLTLVLSGLAYVLVPITSHFGLLVFLIIILGAGLGLGQPLSLPTRFRLVHRIAKVKYWE